MTMQHDNHVRRLLDHLWAQTALFTCVLVILMVTCGEYVW